MNREEIIEGLKDIYVILYANYYLRKMLNLKVIEACFELLENENTLIDRVLEIIDDMCRDDETGMRIDLGIQWLHAKTVREKIAALKGGEHEDSN